MKNNSELKPEVVEAALTAAGISGQRATDIRAVLNDTLTPDSLGLTIKGGKELGAQARLRIVNGRQAPKRDEDLLSVRIEAERGEDTEQRFVDEPPVLADGVIDQIESDPVNLDQRMEGEVDPDTIDETQIHPDFFVTETFLEDLRLAQEQQRRILMRALRRAEARDNGAQPNATIDHLPSPQSAAQLERLGTPRSRRARDNRWQAHA